MNCTHVGQQESVTRLSTLLLPFEPRSLRYSLSTGIPAGTDVPAWAYQDITVCKLSYVFENK